MTPEAAGPVEAVLAEHLPLIPSMYGDGDGAPLMVRDTATAQRLAAALAPLFAAHGAAERRAGAVEALNEAADAVDTPLSQIGLEPDVPRSYLVDWLRARAAALAGDA